MGKFVGGLLAGILMLAWSNLGLCAELKIGYVDVVKVFNDYKKTKDYDQNLADKQKIKEEERDKKIAEIKKLQDQMALLSDAEKKKKEEDLQKKAAELDEFRRQAVLDLRKQQNDFMGEITQEIEKVVKEQAKKGGYDFVLNGQAVLYGQESKDLTSSVLEILNKNYQPASSSKK